MFSHIQFRPGYPEISCQNKQFSVIPKLNIFIEGSSNVQFYPGIEPKPDEIRFEKHRISAANNSELLTLLDSGCIKTVVLIGLTTSRCYFIDSTTID
ncbi:unnamed protein product [Rotaria socialis]|uniref:Isochorismatase-like domain-containing protein n=1 Tax=Rotaria socialis TaxID=392032 RepID=A0A820VK44_9BILA|nr:unnamed protein product [Rotaria socialis]CAF3423728.1 unnamed protein product [Rotaria socialis]CAF3442199.1 unnamed protein product [Rotaria socialis]CAF3666512.1 unnamed protein product [Rotaria socialis]CAF4501348.1 unnamed protein product [Rotaria socialis]